MIRSELHGHRASKFVSQPRVIDRFVRSPKGTSEHVVTLRYTTDGHGSMVAALSIDEVNECGGTDAITLIDVYPYLSRTEASVDGQSIADLYELEFRRATNAAVWYRRHAKQDHDSAYDTDGIE